MGLRVFGFRVWGLGFKIWGLGFRVWGLGFGVQGLEFRDLAVSSAHNRLPRLLERNPEVQRRLRASCATPARQIFVSGRARPEGTEWWTP